MHKWNTSLCIVLGCVVHHLAFTAQTGGGGHTGMGKCLHFARAA